jgi:tetratricopeptide (TPR) repeat protein
MIRRLGRLADHTLRSLEVAAVVGNEFGLDVVTAAMDADEDGVLTGLEEAIDARLVTETEPFRFRFAHALVRASILDGLAQERRGRLHRRVAEAIETLHGDRLDEHLTELALHLAASGVASDADRAMSYAVRAGRAATERLADEEAAASFRLAVELADRPDRQPPTGTAERARLRVLLGEAQRRAGDPAYRDTLLAAGRLAVDAGDGGVAAAAALANRRLLAGPVTPPDVGRRHQLEAAIDLVSGREGPELCRLLAQLGVELRSTDDRSRRSALSERALAMARRVGDPATLADVLLLRIEAIAHADTLDERRRLVDEALDLLAPLPEPAMTARALILGVDAELAAGALDPVDTRLDRAGRLADELGDPTVHWLVKVGRVKRLLLAGRLDEAADVAAEAGALGHTAGLVDAPVVLAIQRLALSAHRGRPDRLMPELTTAVGGRLDEPAVLVLRAWALAGSGRVDDAREQLAAAIERGPGWLPDDEHRLSLAALIAVSAGRVDLPEAAEQVIPELEPYGGLLVVDSAAVWGSVAHFLGLATAALGRFDAAEEQLIEAIDLHRRLGAPVFLAASQAALAGVLAGRGWPGDRARMTRLVEEAGATADDLGLAGLRGELAALTGA